MYGSNLIATLCLVVLFSGPGLARAGEEAPVKSNPAAGEAGGSGGSPAGGAALQGGGPANSGSEGRRSLQDALRECEGLSGSAFAKCQERALYAHPGEED
jgi:hypothetical protein